MKCGILLFFFTNSCHLNVLFSHLSSRTKKERKKVREVGIFKKDPEAIREQIGKLEKMSK